MFKRSIYGLNMIKCMMEESTMVIAVPWVLKRCWRVMSLVSLCWCWFENTTKETEAMFVVVVQR